MNQLEATKILVVDDEPANLAVLFDCLGNLGMNVFLAESGENALQTVKLSRPHLILLDITMPELDGFETCQLLKKDTNTVDIPIIFLSAKTETTDKVKGFDIGAVDYIEKPFRVAEVIARVNTHLAMSQLKQQLKQQNIELQRKANIVDKNVIISTTDKNGIISSVSECFTKITGYSASESIGKSHNILRHPETPLEIYKVLWKTLLNGEVWEGEIKSLNKAGNEYWLHQVITPELNTLGEIQGFTAIAQDITDKKRIEKISMTDNLTGLYNRHKLKEVLSSEMERSQRYQNHFSIILLDVDFFKKINDNYGHQVGDEVLIDLANILKINSRKNDCISRWGGEEFLIVACETDLENAGMLAEKLRIKIENYLFPTVGKVTMSCGVAEYSNGETISKLVSRADDFLYKAKKLGRNKVVKG